MFDLSARRPEVTPRLVGLVVGALLIALATPAGAQNDTTAADASGWRVECANQGKALDCHAIGEIFAHETKQLLASMTIRLPAETKQPVMMVQVPLGILVDQAVAIAVGSGSPTSLVIQTCTAAGCYAGAPIPNPLLTALRTGESVRISFQNLSKQTVTVTLPLSGFAAAYDKLK